MIERSEQSVEATQVGLTSCQSRPATFSKDGDNSAHEPLVSVPIYVDSPCSSSVCQPVTLGIPFPKGALLEPARLHLLDDSGQRIPSQFAVLVRWPDGSVKWLLLDWVIAGVREGLSQWSLVYDKQGKPCAPPGRLLVDRSERSIVVDTGRVCFHVDRHRLLPFARVIIAGKEVLDPRSSGIRLTDSKGRQAIAQIGRTAVEIAGSVRATLRLEGSFAGRLSCRVVTRLCFFTDTGLVRVRLTIHNPKRARHRGGLWDLGDPGSILFRDLTLKLALPGLAPTKTTWTQEVGQPPRSTNDGKLEIYQDSSGGENWQSRNHVNRDGRVPCSFRGYRVRSQAGEEYGYRASPIISLGGPNGRLAAAIPEFWQQFPKAIEVEGQMVCLRLFPQQFADLHELQGGEQKTHTLWLHFDTSGTVADSPLHWVHQPAHVRLAPEWYAASGVFCDLLTDSAEPGGRLESLLADALQGPTNLFARREIIDEYGWRNFGEIYADHEAAYYDGPKPVISHYNNQYDFLYGTLLQYVRTGDRRWYELLDPLTRHIIDIDIYHTDQDKAAYNGGLFWFTDHYKDAGTCTHRTYSRKNCRPGDRRYGGGPSSSHNFTTGLLHYYFLTGDPAAREAVIVLANWVLNMDNGEQNALGLVDPSPTGLATDTGDRANPGAGRSCGNSVNALLDAWLVTNQRSYLVTAEGFFRRSIHPADDVDTRHLLDAEANWSYTVFLSALARYLSLKADVGELDFIYAYAQASLATYACWMLEHEAPYLDRSEQLEYPTETWTAQDLRKANVLRLAAPHMEEPIRSRLLRRGDELADRAWHDLLRFESRSVVRSLAIMMVEGQRDLFFLHHPPKPAPRPGKKYDFGLPETFIPQKQRVFTQLKTIPGFVKAFVQLANTRRWRRLFHAASSATG